jgi:divalent metal cation (Fe/Co/Zn/Cd) transporter
MLFMLATATAALIFKAFEYIRAQNVFLLLVAVILLCLALFVIFEAVSAIQKIFRVKKNRFKGR